MNTRLQLQRMAAAALALAPMAVLCADPAGTVESFSPFKTFLVQLLILAPLAGLAYWLKIKRRKNIPAGLADNQSIVAGALTPLGDGAFGQVIECGSERFLVVRSKTGAIHTTALATIALPIASTFTEAS